MKHPLLEKTTAFIIQENLFTHGDQLCVAISSGIDSVALVYVLQDLGYKFSLAHVNYGLRGEESDGDEFFVQHLANTLGVEASFHRCRADETAAMQSGNLQEKARDIRYDFFANLVAKKGYDRVLTAHHLEDNVETVLLNLIRGTGIKGITGISPLRQPYARPFLGISRDTIEDYAQAKGFMWREDRTN
ncbi:MAG: tRNA lysidine(34) synthetase TilS, partial [Bacteroidota bacterium]